MSNVRYRGGWPKAMSFKNNMNMSNTKHITIEMKGDTTFATVGDSDIQLKSNHGPIQAGGIWRIHDSYYIVDITIQANYWWKCVDKYFPEDITYEEPEVTAPAKKMKKFLLDNVRTMQVNTCFFKKFLNY